MIQEKQKYDVVIVGGGPAGSSAGIVLSRHGLKVLIIEKHKFPRFKLCGGLLTQKTIDLIRNELHIDIEKEISHIKSNRYELFYKNEAVNYADTTGYVYCVQRQDFDYSLIKHAITEGCDVLDGVRVVSVSVNDRIVRTKSEAFSYKFLIGADGANSLIGKEAGLALNSKKTAIGLQIDIDKSLINNGKEIKYPKIYFGYIKYGWGWVFPKPESITVGLGGLFPSGKDLKNTFNIFISDLGIPKSSDTVVRGAVVPYGKFLKNPAKNGVFIAGDAAGFVEPITGEGIYYAILSGVLAAKNIALKSNHKEINYNTDCKKHICKELNQALLARIILFEEPFKSIAFKKLKKDKKHMLSFMKILSGEMTYFQYIWQLIKKKFGTS